MKNVALVACFWASMFGCASAQVTPSASGDVSSGTDARYLQASRDAGLRARADAESRANAAAKELEDTKIIARVGDEVILLADVLGQVNQFLHKQVQKLPEAQRAQFTDEVLESQRQMLIRQVLPQVIDAKLVYLDFLRTIPQEALPEIQDSLMRAFDEQRLPSMIEEAGLETAEDLDRMLRSFGSSLGMQRRSFAEQLAAAQWRQKNGTSNEEVTHEDLLAYYREHEEDFRIIAKAKWEQLTATFAKSGSKEEARRRVAKMGNEVWRGASFAAVAKKGSDGLTASSGGNFDWTSKGSLRSGKLDEAIFSLPLGELSRMIEDSDGFHVIRVTERQKAGVVSFKEVQASIREKIKEQRAEIAMKDYVEKLRKQFSVWTIFEENSPFQ